MDHEGAGVGDSIEITEQPLSWRRGLLRRSDLLSAPLGLRSQEYPWGYVDRYDDYPGYHEGNRIFINAAPANSEIADWCSLYKTLFPERTSRYPTVITWCDGLESTTDVEGAAEFVAFSWSQVDDSLPISPETSAPIREILSSEDWESVERLESHVYPHLTAFNRWRVGSFQSLIRERGGAYRALFSGTSPISSAGAVIDDGIARFLSVATEPNFRNKGFASQLIRSVRATVGNGGRLVTIVAASKSPAEHLYRSLGFLPFIMVRQYLRA